MSRTLNVVLVIFIICLIIKIYLKLTTGWCKNKVCLINKTAIVTGANTGIGYETALEFAKRGCRVILACRNLEKAESAKNRIIEATQNTNIIVKRLNLSSLESVREFAKDINETEQCLDILVNNAGAGIAVSRRTVDNLQMITQINYYSPFLLTLLLIRLLKKSPKSRIVNVASTMAKYGNVKTIENLDNYHGKFGYSNTKLYNVLFTRELAKKLENTNITTYSLHPGAIKTEIFRHMDAFTKTLTMFLANLFFKTPEEGAQTSIYLATERYIEKLNGEHFHDCRHVACYKTAKDSKIARKLWEKTEELVKLKPDENPF